MPLLVFPHVLRVALTATWRRTGCFNPTALQEKKRETVLCRDPRFRLYVEASLSIDACSGLLNARVVGERAKRQAAAAVAPPNCSQLVFNSFLIRVSPHRMEGVACDDFSKLSKKVFLLTHAHTDHMVGLDNTFPNIVFCSEVTARLLRPRFESVQFRVLPMYQMTALPEISANVLAIPGSQIITISLSLTL